MTQFQSVPNNRLTTLMPTGSPPQPPVKVFACTEHSVWNAARSQIHRTVSESISPFSDFLQEWGWSSKRSPDDDDDDLYAQNRARFSRGACDFPLNNQLRNRSIALATLFWGWWGRGPCSGGTHRWFRSITPLVNLPFAGEVTWINYKPDCRFSERVLGVEFARTAVTPFWFSSISKIES